MVEKGTVREIENKQELFNEIALPHWGYIFRSAYKLAGNQSQAEDLTQDAFLAGFEKFHQLRDHKSIKSWLYRIMKNIFLSGLNSNRERPDQDIEQLSGYLGYYNNEYQQTSEDAFSDDMLHQLERLNEKYRTPLLMNALYSYSYKELSKMLDLPLGTIMSRIFRGKEFLRDNVDRSGYSRKTYKFDSSASAA